MATQSKIRKSPNDMLSEIEACVLGLISADGPSTPYAIRKVFLESPSPQWSGSAGTIYPLVERLLRRRLIHSQVFLNGRRRGHRISVTASGSRALEQWLSVPVPDWVAGVTPDPLRTRIRFLGTIGSKPGRQFVRHAYRRVQAHLRTVKADCARRRTGNKFEYLTARGALLFMQSRCEFLREVAEAMGVHLTKQPHSDRSTGVRKDSS